MGRSRSLLLLLRELDERLIGKDLTFEDEGTGEVEMIEAELEVEINRMRIENRLIVEVEQVIGER